MASVSPTTSASGFLTSDMTNQSFVFPLILSLATMSMAWKSGSPACGSSYINYTTVTGFFLQDDPATDPSTFDYSTVNFGLINQTYPTDSAYNRCGTKTQWQRFANYVDSLNEESGDDVSYKVLFMGRHGEGYHNAAESFYGTPAWNCYWAQLDGNGTVTWADASLTPDGVAQALKANSFWKTELADQRIPAPQSYYTSPLTRCLLTANYTFSGLDLPADWPFLPTIKEFFREDISTHTCDRRSSKTHIYSLFPTWTFEPGFSETDELWNGQTGESPSSQFARSKIALDEVFNEDANTWISITSHSGEIASMLSVVGHQVFSLSTGQIIPVLVRAQRQYQAYPTNTIQAWTSSATCTSPPVTSLAEGGCVCSTTTGSAAPTST